MTQEQIQCMGVTFLGVTRQIQVCGNKTQISQSHSRPCLTLLLLASLPFPLHPGTASQLLEQSNACIRHVLNL